MVLDIYGTKIDQLELILSIWKGWCTYRPAERIVFNPNVIRVYLEDSQKELLAKAWGLKADMISDYIELDPEVKEKYEAMYTAGLIKPLRRSD